MERFIASLSGRAVPGRAAVGARVTSPSTSFAEQLRAAGGREMSREGAKSPGNLQLVGEISRSRRTVSELLMHNRELKSSTWKILGADVNRGKDYTRLVEGTKIYYNRQDGSLSWSGADSGKVGQITRTAQGSVATPVFPAVLGQPQFVEDDTPARPSAAGLELGVISRQAPTVSHLLKAHAGFADDTWQILAAGVNQGKDFTTLPVGAVVRIDPATREISWSSSATKTAAVMPAPAFTPAPKGAAVTPFENRAENNPAVAGQATDLTEAVRPYFGTHYREINCYELLVKGLERMNIPYGGKDGLFSKLTRMAREQGLPTNAYLNGEGVVKAAGSLVLAKNYPQTSNWQRAADKLYAEMEPLLDKGQILSFSTRRRGHTGIVSRQQSQWTFINSGRLDNSLTKGSPSQGVGEENLREEIRNWFRLASTSGESLSVTLGTLGREKVVTAFNDEGTYPDSRRI